MEYVCAYVCVRAPGMRKKKKENEKRRGHAHCVSACLSAFIHVCLYPRPGFLSRMWFMLLSVCTHDACVSACVLCVCMCLMYLYVFVCLCFICHTCTHTKMHIPPALLPNLEKTYTLIAGTSSKRAGSPAAKTARNKRLLQDFPEESSPLELLLWQPLPPGNKLFLSWFQRST